MVTRSAVVVLALAAAFLPPAGASASEPPAPAVPAAVVGAPLAPDLPIPASLLQPVVLRIAFRVPRTDTALYVGTPWFVRDLSVAVFGPGARRESITAKADLPG